MSSYSITDSNIPASKMHSMYVHRKRPQWGRAVVVWEANDKRGYQFEDGRLRVFKTNFCHLFDEVDVPDDGVSDVLRKTLRTRAKLLIERKERTSSGETPGVDAPYPFEDQVTIFLAQYPDGFQDKAWVSKLRGVDAKRRLKRHRDSAIAEAQEAFSEEKLSAQIAAGDHSEVIDTLIDQLQSTSLVQRSKVKPLIGFDAEQRVELAEAFFEVLYSDQPQVVTFKRYAQAFGGATHWQLVTAPLALVQPDKHVCVRPSVFRKQAATMAPMALYSRDPSPHSYRDMRRVARATMEKLEEEGYKPRDFVDIYDFVWCTLRPSAEKYLDEV